MGFEFGKEEVRTDDGREEVIRRVEYEKVVRTNGVVGYGGRRWRIEMEQLREDHFFYKEPAVDYKLSNELVGISDSSALYGYWCRRYRSAKIFAMVKVKSSQISNLK